MGNQEGFPERRFRSDPPVMRLRRISWSASQLRAKQEANPDQDLVSCAVMD